MVRPALLSLGIALVAALALAPSQAGAKTVRTAPPGLSGVDQYVEAVPSATGNRPDRPNTGLGGPVLTRKQVRKLAALGPRGRAAAAVAQANGTPRGPLFPGSLKGKSGPFDVLGWILPLGLGTSLIGAAGWGLARRQRLKVQT